MPAATLPEIDASDDDAWRAVIGPKNQDYYLDRFADIRAGGGGIRPSWHWPAFFVTWYWLLYRKMWLWALVYFLMPAVLAAGFGMVAGIAGKPSLASGYLIVQLLLTFVAAPVLANALYFKHCAGKLASVERGVSRERQLARLDAVGGTSNIVVILIGLFGGVMLIGVLAAIALPAYSDYTKRAKVAQILSVAMPVAQRAGEAFERTGRFPQSLAGMPELRALPPYSTGMSIDEETGVIEIGTTVAPLLGQEGSIYLMPVADAGRHVAWSCRTGPRMRKYVPASCRNER